MEKHKKEPKKIELTQGEKWDKYINYRAGQILRKIADCIERRVQVVEAGNNYIYETPNPVDQTLCHRFNQCQWLMLWPSGKIEILAGKYYEYLNIMSNKLKNVSWLILPAEILADIKNKNCYIEVLEIILIDFYFALPNIKTTLYDLLYDGELLNKLIIQFYAERNTRNNHIVDEFEKLKNRIKLNELYRETV